MRFKLEYETLFNARTYLTFHCLDQRSLGFDEHLLVGVLYLHHPAFRYRCLFYVNSCNTDLFKYLTSTIFVVWRSPSRFPTLPFAGVKGSSASERRLPSRIELEDLFARTSWLATVAVGVSDKVRGA